MQTFLPYAKFTWCAKVLDYRRLGKQRVEAMQILNCLDLIKHGKINGWCNHPAVRMWACYEQLLKYYMNTMIDEWIRRGYKNTMKKAEIPPLDDPSFILPDWLHDERLHSSHRANLLRKLPEHYSRFGWTEEPQEGYWWPYRRVKGEWVNYIY